MPDEVAIIGIAGRFPGASNLRELHCNLQEARDCVAEIPAQRFCETNFPIRPERYQVIGLLDEVEVSTGSSSASRRARPSRWTRASGSPSRSPTRRWKIRATARPVSPAST